MKTRNGAIIALLLLATCSQDLQEQNSTESAQSALGLIPPSEVAVWRKLGESNLPASRYLQAVAFDESRKAIVMFGGSILNPNMGTMTPNQETWEWSLATGKWTNRTGTGPAPNARSGAVMVFDSSRGKLVLFGGRSGSGADFEDTWEFDPATGAWTNVSAAGPHPSGRSQHGMVYQKTTGKVLLFGGGRSNASSYDPAGISLSLGDTWEYDPAAYSWTQITATTAPSVRHAFGLVWDSSRGKAVLFAGMQSDIAGASGVPKQDTWEWDPATAAWTEVTAPGNKPSQRYGHAMAFDGSRKKVVVFGGWDISTGYALSDLWDWEPSTHLWTQRLTGREAGLPSPRMYASMISDEAGGRLEIVGGASYGSTYGGTGGYYGTGGSYGGTGPYGDGGYWGGTTYYGAGGVMGYGGTSGVWILPPPGPAYSNAGSREVWELNPATPAFTNRSAALDVPSTRSGQAMAYDPTTGRSYLFGGYDSMTGQGLSDLWAWDGKTWAQVSADPRPPARSDGAMAYDPARKSIILYGGIDNYNGTPFDDTWELTSAGKWAKLATVASPGGLTGHAMVTDTTRNKVLLYGGMAGYTYSDIGPYRDPMRNDVWEWDGAALRWSNRTPTALAQAPNPRQYPQIGYDESRQKLLVYDGSSYGISTTSFWEWDAITAGWMLRDTGDNLPYVNSLAFVFDSVRRRGVVVADPSSSPQVTLEVEPKRPTWYVRSLSTSPGSLYGSSAVFDSLRGVVVLFGGQSMYNSGSETWEYSVTGLGNGEGCTAKFTTSCASGNCADGVCCDVAACTGACKSCNVAGSEGTCVLVKAGTQVVGSCADGQSCDGSGSCKAENGQPCTAAGTCASGFCADGVCCDGACSGTCASCNQVGRTGKCTPFTAGTDPQSECGRGTGVCKSTCDGVGSCSYPGYTVSCGDCRSCDGYGSCSNYDYNCGGYGTGGYPWNTGGIWATGGWQAGGSGGGIPNRGGSGGYVPSYGGAAGNPGSAVPSNGGDEGNGDAGTKTKLSDSGCGCVLGSARPWRTGMAAPLFVVGAALLLARRRARRG
jgi:hypothetical protein